MERENVVDVIIPVYRPDEKLEKLIERLNQQTVEPRSEEHTSELQSP